MMREVMMGEGLLEVTVSHTICRQKLDERHELLEVLYVLLNTEGYISTEWKFVCEFLRCLHQAHPE